ncbi:G10-like protein, partial [Helicosporidium sp. ATCC 50920]
WSRPFAANVCDVLFAGFDNLPFFACRSQFQVVEDFEQQMKDAVNEDHDGKRRNETSWKIHRLHWEKNRFFFDLMYGRKVMSRELFDWLVRQKIADGALISKWRKPGYEILCSLLAIQKGNHNFGTTSHCRVPMRQRAAQQRITPDVQTGCICCASGDGRFGGPVWWNTPLEDPEEAGAAPGRGRQDHRATWAAEDEIPAAEDEEAGAGEGGEEEPAVPSRKRPAPEDATFDDEGEDLDEEVKRRLQSLRGQA